MILPQVHLGCSGLVGACPLCSSHCKVLYQSPMSSPPRMQDPLTGHLAVGPDYILSRLKPADCHLVCGLHA